MGCCCSRYCDNDNEQQEATTPLLAKSNSGPVICGGSKKSPYRSLYMKQEEEKIWLSIIDRTSKLMIDNNLYPSLNPLSPQEISERQKKYIEILQKVKIPPSITVSDTLLSDQHQQDFGGVFKILEEAKPYDIKRDFLFNGDEDDPDIFEKIINARNQINKSLDGHGDFVVPMKKVVQNKVALKQPNN